LGEQRSRLPRVSGPQAFRDQSVSMLADRITLPHFSVSSTMSLPKSAGEPVTAFVKIGCGHRVELHFKINGSFVPAPFRKYLTSNGYVITLDRTSLFRVFRFRLVGRVSR
jgi:hypothetical protein